MTEVLQALILKKKHAKIIKTQRKKCAVARRGPRHVECRSLNHSCHDS